MAIPSLSSLIFVLISTLAGLITFGMEHPRGQYYENIPDVKNDRLAEVTNALGPIVSDVIEFMQDGEDGSPEELTEIDRATVALADSISPSDDLPDLKSAMKEFYWPERVFKWCRRTHDSSYIFFVCGVVFGVIPAVNEINSISFQIPGLVGAVSYWLAAIATSTGIILFFSFLYLRSELDDMTEQADFKVE